jgi:ABC-type glutathione transport system ATPase component
VAQPIDKITDVSQIYPFLESLCRQVENLLIHKRQILISVVGKSGTGKTTLGRHIRKKGLGRLPPGIISVIDDGVMSLEVLAVFRRKVRIPEPKQRDELKPFLDLLPRRKRVVLFVGQAPDRRVSRVDILLHLKTDHDQRLQQLADRRGGFDKIPKHALDPQEQSDFGIEADQIIEGMVYPFPVT